MSALVHVFLAVGSSYAAETVTYPFFGITHTDRTETVPRPLRIHVIKIDLDEPTLHFMVTPQSGARDTIIQTTRQFLASQAAQLAINAHFFTPFPDDGTGYAWLIGLAASSATDGPDGHAYAPFDRNLGSPFQDDLPALNIGADNTATLVYQAAGDITGYATDPPVDLYNAISGNEQILSGGVNVAGSTTFDTTLNPRTAIGIAPGNTLVLFTVDGRQFGSSEGMTTAEVADLLRSDYGVTDAINLDGGGSTTLAMADPTPRVVNVPVGVGNVPASERLVGSNLAVFAEACSVATEGMACGDDDLCNGVETCVTGVCQSGTPAADGTPCDDGLFCDGADTCAAGECTHGGNPCAPLQCSESAGACVTPVRTVTPTVAATPTSTRTPTPIPTRTPTLTPTPGPTTTVIVIRASADDAEEVIATGVVNLTSTDLELTYDSPTTGQQMSGVRFPNVLIPRGATITEAYVQFTNDSGTDSETSGAMTVTFAGQKPSAGATEAPFVACGAACPTPNNLRSRPTVAPTVNWNPQPWTTPGTKSPTQRTNSLVPILQAQVNDANWQSGHAVVLLMTNPSTTVRRIAASWDLLPTGSGAAELHLSYSGAAPTATTTPTTPTPISTAPTPTASATRTATPTVTSTVPTPTPTATPLFPVLRCPSGQAGCPPIIQAPDNDPTKLTFRWWTDLATTADDEVQYGTQWNVLTGAGTNPVLTDCEGIAAGGRCHEVTITGLAPDTDYFYQLKSENVVVQAASSAIKARTLAATQPTTMTFAVIGDFGSGTAASSRIRDLMDAHPAAMIVTVGDNAYTFGTVTEWENNVLKIYATRFKNGLFWPTVGNHDMNNGYDAVNSWPLAGQRKLFHVPSTVGTCRVDSTNPGARCTGDGDCTGGGTCNLPTSPEEFYSFDSGDVHFVVVSNSFGSETGSTGWSTGKNQRQWLIDDLAATQKKWKFAFHHNSTYSCPNPDGHGSNLSNRAKLSPIFEYYGVTMAFMGHDHVWSRSVRVDDYSDLGGTSGSDGKGTYYVTQGTGGQTGAGRCLVSGADCLGRTLGGSATSSCGRWLAKDCAFPAPIATPSGAEKWCSYGNAATQENSFTLVTITSNNALTLKTYASYAGGGDYVLDEWTMPTATPTPLPSATTTAAATATATSTPTPTGTATTTHTPVPTVTATPTVTVTAVATPTATTTATSTATASATPAATASATRTATTTPIATATASHTATATPLASPIPTTTVTSTRTATATGTATPGATSTRTATPIRTATPTASVTLIRTPTAVATPTATRTPRGHRR